MQVAQMWRFPVKSMQGETLERGALTSRGFDGDRRYAVIEAETGKIMTGKRYGALLLASARTDDAGNVLIDVPGGDASSATDPAIDEILSSYLGRACRLVAVDGEHAGDFEMSFNVDSPDEDLFAWPCPPGTFLDLASAHLLTTASLEAARALQPAADWDVRRFRPTLFLDAGGESGFVEDAWVGRDVRVGDAGLRVDMPTVRCPLPTRAQPGLDRDLRMAHALRDHHDNNLGVYATVTTAGEVAVGDELTLV